MTTKKTPITRPQIEKVWASYREHQSQPSLCRLTENRAERIKRAIRELQNAGGDPLEDLDALFDFAYNSDSRIAKFWRGERPESPDGKIYIGIDMLIGPEKLARRVEMALYWRAGEPLEPHHENPADAEISPSPVQRFRTDSRARAFGKRGNR